MVTPRRRSNRLRGSPAASASKLSKFTVASPNLSSLLEREETPDEKSTQTQSTLDAIVSSPPEEPIHIPGAFPSSILHTPSTATRPQPSLEEMHPTLVHQTTTKKPDSGLRLGFTDVVPKTEPISGKSGLAVAQDTPTKSTNTVKNPFSSPTFEFKFAHAESNLSSEAQKMMEDLREEAAELKAKMAAEKYEQERKDREAEQLYGVGGRKIAKAKGKAGRFSNAHMSAFKKMDSIAGHPSAFRAQLSRTQPTQPAHQATPSLKRHKYYDAELDYEYDSDTIVVRPLSLKKNEDGSQQSVKGSKRLKRRGGDDISSARPVSRDGTASPKQTSKSAIPRSLTGLPTAITTPTKASLARSASVKQPSKTMIPSLSRSASSKSLAASPPKYSPPKTEGNHKHLPSMTSLRHVKSILRAPRILYSEDPAKQAAGTHKAPPKLDLQKDLPSVPGTPIAGMERNTAVKHVNFTPTTLSKAIAQPSPSATKLPVPSNSKQETNMATTPSSAIAYPITYPVLPHSVAPSPSPLRRAATPGAFTFRSDKRLVLNAAAGTPLGTGRTIRHVRPSVAAPTTASSANLTALTNLPAVPHGMPNKKRKHDSSSAADPDDEGVPGTSKASHDGGERAAKKARVTVEDTKKENASPVKMAKASSVLPRGKTPKLRGVLSLARLNALARPRERK